MEDQKTTDQKPPVVCPVCAKEVINLGSHMRAHQAPTDKPSEAAKKITLRTVSGKEVPLSDYFFKGTVPPGFINTCGKPVDREDLLDVFNKVFKPEDNFLFYKVVDKEVYLIIVPIKYSTIIGEENNSLEGDFQKHAISFLNEGSVNPDTLKSKLGRILKFCKFDGR